MLRVAITETGRPTLELDFVGPQVTVGRSAECEIVLPSNRVSKRHATLVVRAGEIVLTDEGSTNGTYVNGQLLSGSRVISERDLVEMGDYKMVFKQLAAPPPTVTMKPSGYPSAMAKPSAARGPTVEVKRDDPWKKRG